LDDELTFERLLNFVANFWNIKNMQLTFVNPEGIDYSSMFYDYLTYLKTNIATFIDNNYNVRFIVVVMKVPDATYDDLFIRSSNLLAPKVFLLWFFLKHHQVFVFDAAKFKRFAIY
jgi:hypothetical protein